MVCFTVGKKYMRIGNYIKIGTFIIIGIFVFPYVLCAQNGYYFFRIRIRLPFEILQILYGAV